MILPCAEKSVTFSCLWPTPNSLLRREFTVLCGFVCSSADFLIQHDETGGKAMVSLPKLVLDDVDRTGKNCCTTVIDTSSMHSCRCKHERASFTDIVFFSEAVKHVNNEDTLSVVYLWAACKPPDFKSHSLTIFYQTIRRGYSFCRLP